MRSSLNAGVAPRATTAVRKYLLRSETHWKLPVSTRVSPLSRSANFTLATSRRTGL